MNFFCTPLNPQAQQKGVFKYDQLQSFKPETDQPHVTYIHSLANATDIHLTCNTKRKPLKHIFKKSFPF
jgi:hypothetical protein